MPRKLTQEEFEEKVRAMYPDGEYIVLGEYISSDTHVLIKHVTCGNEYMVTPHLFFTGRRCRKCYYNINADRKRKSEDILQKQIDDIHGVREYVLVGKYKNAHTNTEFYHRECNKNIYMTPNQLVQGYKCAECSHKQSGIEKRKNHEQYVEEVNAINPDIIILGKYIRSIEKINVKCKVCGHIWNPYAGSLINTCHASSCPKCVVSRGEKCIINYFNKKNIHYETQKTFNDLRGVGNGKLSYDIFVPTMNALIEFQGQQHESVVPLFHKSKCDFEKQLEHDRRKREYAKSHNINLLEIWYYDFNRIEEILDKELDKLIAVA